MRISFSFLEFKWDVPVKSAGYIKEEGRVAMVDVVSKRRALSWWSRKVLVMGILQPIRY